MAALFEKFKGFISASDLDEELYDYDEYDDDEMDYEPTNKRAERVERVDRFERAEKTEKERVTPIFTKTENEKVLSMNAKKDYEIVYFTPENESQASAIAKSFKEGKLCIINVMALPDNEAQTMADFIAGAAFALNGAIKPISEEIFIAIPSTISYRGDFYDDVAKFTNSNFFN